VKRGTMRACHRSVFDDHIRRVGIAHYHFLERSGSQQFRNRNVYSWCVLSIWIGFDVAKEIYEGADVQQNERRNS
jgi:hypothetical protein